MKSSVNFELFQKKKKTVIVNVFLRLRTLKHLVRSMSKKSSLRLLFEKQHGKRAPALLKYERQYLSHIY